MRWRGFWLVALTALAIRLAYLAQIRGTPLTDVLLIDAETYDRFARRILAGTFHGEDVYSMNPLYPFYLAGVYALSGGATFAALVAQAVLGALNAALVFALGWRLFRPSTAWVAGLAAACYAPYVFFTGALLTPTLVETFLLVALLMLAIWRTKPSRALLAAAGLATGLATLGRGNAILIVAMTPLFFRVEMRTWRRAWGPWLLFTAAALALPALVTARNAAVEGRLVPVSANYAAFYIGHFPKANGLFSKPDIATGAGYQDEVVGVREVLSREMGRPLTQAEASRELLARGLHWAGGHPREELVLAARKFYFFWNHLEAHTNLSFYVARDYSGLLRALPLGFGIVAPLGLAGMLAARRRWREHLLLHLAVLVPLVTCVAFFVSAEYRLPAVAPLLLFAADAVVRSAAWLAARARPAPAKTKRRSRSRPTAGAPQHAPAIPAATWVVLGLAPILAWAANTTTPLLREQTGNRFAYLNYAMAYAGRGQLEGAADMMRRMQAADPALAQVDRRRVEAEQLFQAGRYAEALPMFEQTRARYLELGGREEATTTANSIGLTLYHLGRYTEAERVLSGIVASDAGFMSAHNSLALVYEAQGRAQEAMAEYQRVLAIEPRDRDAASGIERLESGRRTP